MITLFVTGGFHQNLSDSKDISIFQTTFQYSIYFQECRLFPILFFNLFLELFEALFLNNDRYLLIYLINFILIQTVIHRTVKSTICQVFIPLLVTTRSSFVFCIRRSVESSSPIGFYLLYFLQNILAYAYRIVLYTENVIACIVPSGLAFPSAISFLLFLQS